MPGRAKLSGKAAAARDLTHALRDLVLAYKATLEDAVGPHGLTLPQLRMLNAVAEQTEVSAAAIARQCHVTPQTLQAILTRAVREGWIVRGTSAKNHRILTVSLTAKGRKMLELGQNAASSIEESMWQDVSRKSLERGIALLQSGAKRLSRDPAESL